MNCRDLCLKICVTRLLEPIKWGVKLPNTVIISSNNQVFISYSSRWPFCLTYLSRHSRDMQLEKHTVDRIKWSTYTFKSCFKKQKLELSKYRSSLKKKSLISMIWYSLVIWYLMGILMFHKLPTCVWFLRGYESYMLLKPLNFFEFCPLHKVSQISQVFFFSVINSLYESFTEG